METQPLTQKKAFPEGILLPFGGHKGYGILLLVELLSSVLIGGALSAEMSQQFVVQGGMLVAVIRPTIFRNYEDYVRDMKKLKMRIKSSKPAKGFKEVLLPGEPEERIAEERKKKGIPLDEGTIEELSRVAKELNIDPLKEIG